jgi:hypothetical protein
MPIGVSYSSRFTTTRSAMLCWRGSPSSRFCSSQDRCCQAALLPPPFRLAAPSSSTATVPALSRKSSDGAPKRGKRSSSAIPRAFTYPLPGPAGDQRARTRDRANRASTAWFASQPSVELGRDVEVYRFGRRVGVQQLGNPARATMTQACRCLDRSTAQPTRLKVERGRVAPPGQRVQHDRHVLLPALEPIGRADRVTLVAAVVRGALSGAVCAIVAGIIRPAAPVASPSVQPPRRATFADQ